MIDARTLPLYEISEVDVFKPGLFGSMARHTYEYDIDLNSDTAPARVIRMIGKNRRVLEVGAGPGSITRHLVEASGCDVVALEIDPSAIEKLKVFCDRVYAVDLNRKDWADDLKAEDKFDVIIAADVLEHVYDPLSTLMGMKSLLRGGGEIILSIPHVAHSALVSCILDENFQYRDWGLLDRTHIRFFGLKNINELYSRAGLSIVDAEFVIRSPEQTELAPVWEKTSDTVKAALQTNKFGNVYQIVSKAKDSSVAERKISLLDLIPESPQRQLPDIVLDAHPYVGFVRKIVRDNFSSSAKARVRKIVGKLGLHV